MTPLASCLFLSLRLSATFAAGRTGLLSGKHGFTVPRRRQSKLTWATSEYDLRTRTTSSWRPRSVGALHLELVLAHTLEAGDAEHAAVDEPAKPAVAPVGVELVFV